MKSLILVALGFIAASALQIDQELPNVLAQTEATVDGDDCVPCRAFSDFSLTWEDGFTGGCIAERSDISCCPNQCVELR